jgi:O-antigen ligase
LAVVAATGTVSLRERATTALADVGTEALVLAVAIPILFIHVRYQPKFHLRLSSTSVGVELSDFAVLAVVLAAIAAGVRHGFGRLRRGTALWVAALLYFSWIVVEVAIPHGTAGYPTSKHAVTAAKLAEYALLAPSVVLVLRNRIELRLVFAVVTAWTVLATLVGLIQFFGANIFVSGATGGRQLSFLGFHDFASLSAAALILGAATFALPRLALERRLGWLAVVAGCIGVILSAALAAVIGIAIASAAIALFGLMRRELVARGLTIAGIAVAIALVGAVAMRGKDLGQYFGVQKEAHASTNVESYAHRTVLAYIGYRMWRDHPVAGVGFEASNDASRYLRYVPAAKRRYPNEPALAFPTATRVYGVQNFYIQHLADLGVVGLVLLALIFAATLGVGLRALGSTGAMIGVLWTLVVAGLWIAQGIVAGLPLDALTWIAFGLAARG